MKVIFSGHERLVRYGDGNTICTLVQTERYDILLDAGNGIHRAAGLLEGAKPVFLFLSHFHIDHIEGLHILAKFRFREGLTICAPHRGREILGTFINAPFTIPSPPFLSGPHPGDAGRVRVLPFLVKALPLRHASLTLGYRFAIDGRIISYCPDTGYCENAVALSLASDLLITECAYKEGQSFEEWPHLNPETAARIAREAGQNASPSPILTQGFMLRFPNGRSRRRSPPPSSPRRRPRWTGWRLFFNPACRGASGSSGPSTVSLFDRFVRPVEFHQPYIGKFGPDEDVRRIGEKPLTGDGVLHASRRLPSRRTASGRGPAVPGKSVERG